MAQDKGLLFFYDWQTAFEALSGDECKALLLAMLDYRRDGIEPPKFEGGAKIAAAFIFPAIDRSIERAESGQKGGLRTQQSSKSAQRELEASSNLSSTTKQDKDERQDQNKTFDSSPDKPTEARARPSSVDEVRAYCEERQNNIDPQRFMDFYESNGWVQGKGKPIKDWKAAVRTWEQRDREAGKTAVSAENTGSFDTDSFFDAALARTYKEI